MSTTVASPALSFPANHNGTDYLGLGDLITLPLEVRDEIYRYLVKGVYHAATSNWPTIDPKVRSMLTRPEQRGLEPNTLQVSNAIKDEAERILYSESLFLCTLDCSAETASPPPKPFDRMMNIEIEVLSGVHVLYCDSGPKDLVRIQNQNEKWETVITRLNDTHLVRKFVHVKFRICAPQVRVHLAVAKKMLHDLRTLIKCRTLIVEFASMLRLKDRRSGHQTDLERTRRYIKGIDFLAETTMGDLELALGPATLGHTRAPDNEPGYIRYASFLEFHPQKHIAKRSSI